MLRRVVSSLRTIDSVRTDVFHDTIVEPGTIVAIVGRHPRIDSFYRILVEGSLRLAFARHIEIYTEKIE